MDAVEVVRIREAIPNDSLGISIAHVQSWQESYRGIIDAAYLQSLAPDSRAKMWLERLNDPSFGGKVYVAETSKGRIVGFVGVGPSRAEEFKGQGIGRDLFQKGKEWLRDQGFSRFFCWVLKKNPTCRFYESVGGVSTRYEKPTNIGGDPLIEIAYEWTL